MTVSDDMACYNACNVIHRSYVDRSVKAWYHVWNRDENEGQKKRYYCMELKCFVWINGKDFDQCEEE